MSGDFLAVFFLAGVVVILGWEAFSQFRLARKASSWPTVPGRIVSAELEDGPMMGRFIRVASHRAVVHYTYEVAGREWTSQRVFFGDRAFDKGDGARDRVRRYEPDSVVQVSYDPDDPSSAVLEPRAAWSQSATRALTWVVLMILTTAAIFITGRGRL